MAFFGMTPVFKDLVFVDWAKFTGPFRHRDATISGMKKNRAVHFLVVEDEVEIADIICLFVGGGFSAQFTVARSGEEALQFLSKIDAHFDMVISDFNMPKGDGLFVYNYVKEHHAQLPFILVTSDAWGEHPEFHGSARVGYVAKPFIDDTLMNEVERILKLCDLESYREHQYVGISLQTLVNFKFINHPMFVKLNEDKYVRFLNAGSTITPDDIAKYRQKGISYLYVEKEIFNTFISDFKAKVLNEMVFRGFQYKTQEALEISTAVQEILVGATRTFGLSPETQDLAQRNLELVKGLSERIVELDSVFQWASFSQMEYSFLHSVLICYLTTEVARNLPIAIPHASEILALASCFHDIALENHQVKNEPRFIKAIEINSNINREDMLSVREHSEVAVQMMKNWPTCPQEVLKIIIEHHERPDGKGFPAGKVAADISDLGACFIVCEDLAQTYLEYKDKVTVIRQFSSRTQFYAQGPFAKYHHYLLDKLLGNTAKEGNSVAS